MGKYGRYVAFAVKNPSNCQSLHDARDRLLESIGLVGSMELVWSGSRAVNART